jgi:hypothetical protein
VMVFSLGKRKSVALVMSCLVSTVFLSACELKSDQLSNLIGSNQKEQNLNNYYWDLIVGDKTYKLLAVSIPENTIFADNDGRSVVFDGWKISKITGFETIADTDIQLNESAPGDKNEYQVIVGTTASVRYSCDPWAQVNSAQGKVYSQTCSHKNVNEIEIDTSGNILKIEQFIPFTNKYWTLKKSQ